MQLYLTAERPISQRFSMSETLLRSIAITGASFAIACFFYSLTWQTYQSIIISRDVGYLTWFPLFGFAAFQFVISAIIIRTGNWVVPALLLFLYFYLFFGMFAYSGPDPKTAMALVGIKTLLSFTSGVLTVLMSARQRPRTTV
ncbi:hypothetical protein BH11ARM1_BH11ARM1_16500 [soil metagenome]